MVGAAVRQVVARHGGDDEVPQFHPPGGFGDALRLVGFERSGLAVDTAQKPHARVQRSPAIITWPCPSPSIPSGSGTRRFPQTVCSLSSSSRLRVRAKLSDVGSVMRSQSGRRGRGFDSVVAISRFSATDSMSNQTYNLRRRRDKLFGR